MDFFSLGKKKNDNVEEYVLGLRHKNYDKNYRKKEEYLMKDKCDDMTNGKDCKQDYIDPDEFNYEDYDDIVGAIEDSGWHCMSPENHSLTAFDDDIVIKKDLEAGSSGNIIEIICPPRKIISICGVEECNIDIEDFYNMPNLFGVPHFFTIQCTSDDKSDIPSDTIVSIWKVAINGEYQKYCQSFYGDISFNDDGNLKRKEERYYFPTTVVLQGGEKLVVKIHDCIKNIDESDLFAMADIFEKDECGE